MTSSFTERECTECSGTGKVRVRTKSGLGRMAKNKGRSTELRVAKAIAEAIGVSYEECRRTPNSGALIERGDLRLSNMALTRFPWFIEVKARESWDFFQLFSLPDPLVSWEPFTWYREAELKAASDARNGFGDGTRHPVMLVLLRNRKEPLALLTKESAVRAGLMFPHVAVGEFVVMKFKILLDHYRAKLAESAPV